MNLELMLFGVGVMLGAGIPIMYHLKNTQGLILVFLGIAIALGGLFIQ